MNADIDNDRRKGSNGWKQHAARRLMAALGAAFLLEATASWQGVFGGAAAIAQPDEQVNIRVYQVASPAVVSIEGIRGGGSGTIVDPQGLVLTNAHVVRGSERVRVALLDGRRFDGRVVASSRQPDLALIRLDGVDGTLPAVRVTTSPVQVGQRAFAIGNPFGRFAGTLTTGIVSRLDRDRHLIQTDAALHPGNSGGPLLNGRGELIGINTAILAARTEGSLGLSFAIAAEKVREFLAAAQAGRIGLDNPIRPPLALSLDGNPVAATLTPDDDTLTDGSSFKAYAFVGRAGQRVAIEMRSPTLDSYLVLFDPRGVKIADDDDSGGNKDARLTAVLPTDGTYILYANAYDPGEAGNFVLSGRAEAVGALPVVPLPGGTIFQHRGELGAGSRILARDGSLFDAFTFVGRAGDVVRVTLSSGEFQPYLVVYAPDRRAIAESRATLGQENAVATFTLPTTGTYRVIANASEPQGKGRYTLTVLRLQ